MDEDEFISLSDFIALQNTGDIEDFESVCTDLAGRVETPSDFARESPISAPPASEPVLKFIHNVPTIRVEMYPSSREEFVRCLDRSPLVVMHTHGGKFKTRGALVFISDASRERLEAVLEEVTSFNFSISKLDAIASGNIDAQLSACLAYTSTLRRDGLWEEDIFSHPFCNGSGAVRIGKRSVTFDIACERLTHRFKTLTASIQTRARCELPQTQD